MSKYFLLVATIQIFVVASHGADSKLVLYFHHPLLTQVFKKALFLQVVGLFGLLGRSSLGFNFFFNASYDEKHNLIMHPSYGH